MKCHRVLSHANCRFIYRRHKRDWLVTNRLPDNGIRDLSHPRDRLPHRHGLDDGLEVRGVRRVLPFAAAVVRHPVVGFLVGVDFGRLELLVWEVRVKV